MQLAINTFPDTTAELTAEAGLQRGARKAQRMQQSRSTDIIISPPDGERTPRTVQVTDVSLTGIAFRTEEPVNEQTPFLLPRHSAKSALAYTVVHCRRDEQHFVVGAELNGAVDLKTSQVPATKGKARSSARTPAPESMTSRMFGKIKRRFRLSGSINFSPAHAVS